MLKNCDAMHESRIVEKFWKTVTKTSSCWTRSRAYSQVWLDSTRRVLAHRFSWQIHFGAIPKGMQVNHHCDNPKCVRPEHLYIGTQQDNMRDASERLRFNGENHHASKVENRDVAEIRKLRKSGAKLQWIADKFSMTKQNVWFICSLKTWRHI